MYEAALKVKTSDMVGLSFVASRMPMMTNSSIVSRVTLDDRTLRTQLRQSGQSMTRNYRIIHTFRL